MNKRFLLLIFCLALTIPLFSQSFTGYNYNNYQSAGGMVFNPASMAGSRYKVNVNIVSVNVGVSNNAYEFNKKSFFKGDDLSEGINFNKINNSSPKDLFVNFDIIGPSFMIELGPKIGSIGFSSRVRFLMNEGNLDNDFFQVFGNKNAQIFDKTHTQNDLILDAHAFADLGLSYARTIWSNNSHVVKGGATIKYVLGMAAGSFRIDNLSIQLEKVISEDFIKELKGDVSLMYSKGIDDAIGDGGALADVWSQTENNSIGFDFGFEYEWYHRGNYQPAIFSKDIWRMNIQTPYTLKVSASITDIGSIKYNLSEYSQNYRFDLSNAQASDFNFDEDNLTDYIDKLKNKGFVTELNNESRNRFSLPTMFRLNVDYNAYKRLFVNAGASINILGNSKYGGRYGSHYYVTPRYESKWVSVYSPLSFSPMGQFNWGIGFNFGVFYFGSGSILNNLFSSKLKGADVYVGISVPIGQKKAIEIISPETERIISISE